MNLQLKEFDNFSGIIEGGLPVKMLLVNIECKNEQEMETFMNSPAAIVGKYLCIRLRDETVIRIIDLTGQKGRESIEEKNLKGIQESEFVEPHAYRTIDIQGMLEAVKNPYDPHVLTLRALR